MCRVQSPRFAAVETLSQVMHLPEVEVAHLRATVTTAAPFQSPGGNRIGTFGSFRIGISSPGGVPLRASERYSSYGGTSVLPMVGLRFRIPLPPAKRIAPSERLRGAAAS